MRITFGAIIVSAKQTKEENYTKVDFYFTMDEGLRLDLLECLPESIMKIRGLTFYSVDRRSVDKTFDFSFNLNEAAKEQKIPDCRLKLADSSKFHNMWMRFSFQLRISWISHAAVKDKLPDSRLNVALFKDDSTKDITIRVADGEVKCHKAVLAAQSKVLAGMLPNGTEIVEMQDMTTAGIIILLKYLYGLQPSVDELQGASAVFQLYQAAQKYDLVELQASLRQLVDGKLLSGI